MKPQIYKTNKELYDARKKFLDDTVEYYSVAPKERRAVDIDGLCRYKATSGAKCAIGRHIIEDKYSYHLEGAGPTFLAEMGALPAEIVELRPHFLVAVQQLHDSEQLWNETGLNDAGKRQYDTIVTAYCNDLAWNQQDAT